MTETELAIRELVIQSDWELRQKVIKEMIKYWDSEGKGGCFQDFIIQEFRFFWLAMVIRN